MPVMEEADLCVKMSSLGRIRLVNRVVRTSDRRIAEWGELRANWIYLKVGVRWALAFVIGSKIIIPTSAESSRSA